MLLYRVGLGKGIKRQCHHVSLLPWRRLLRGNNLMFPTRFPEDTLYLQRFWKLSAFCQWTTASAASFFSIVVSCTLERDRQESALLDVGSKIQEDNTAKIQKLTAGRMYAQQQQEVPDHL